MVRMANGGRSNGGYPTGGGSGGGGGMCDVDVGDGIGGRETSEEVVAKEREDEDVARRDVGIAGRERK